MFNKKTDLQVGWQDGYRLGWYRVELHHPVDIPPCPEPTESFYLRMHGFDAGVEQGESDAREYVSEVATMNRQAIADEKHDRRTRHIPNWLYHNWPFVAAVSVFVWLVWRTQQ